MRKTALFIVFLILMMSSFVYASGEMFSIYENKVTFDAVNCSLSFKGSLKDAKTNTYILMEIYPSGKTSHISDIAAVSDTLTNNEEFIFDSVLLPETLKPGKYTIRLSSFNKDATFLLEDAFYYGGKDVVKTHISDIDLKNNTTDIDYIIKNNYDDLGFLYFNKYSNITSVDTALYEILNEDFPVDDENFKKSWQKLLELLKRGTLAALILETESASVIKDIVENEDFARSLQLEEKPADNSFSAYHNSSPQTKEIIYELMLSKKYLYPSDVRNALREKSAVGYIRNEHYTDIIKVLDSVADIEKTDYTYYNLLYPITQDALLKSVCEKAKTVYELKEITDFFESESLKLYGQMSYFQGGSTGSSSGGSTGGGGGSFTPVIENKEVKNDEIKITFNDIKDVKWAETAILSLAKKGVINGISEGKFSPNDNITRAQLAKIAVLAFSLKNDDKNKKEFSDINVNAWYKEYIDILSSNNIVNGYEDGTFKPDSFITRQELSVIIDRILKLKSENKERIREFSEFSDNNLISDYALESIKNLYEYGILNGDGKNVMPLSYATRAQTAQLVYLLIK